MNTKWTNQEFFDFCKKEFLSPEFKQCMNKDYCLYFNHRDNNKCIIGKTMPPNEAARLAASDSSEQSVSALLENKHPAVAHLTGVDCLLLTQMQLLHDNYNKDSLVSKLKSLAKIYNLKYEPYEPQ